MQETPDISKIISVIMQNPALISEIAALANATKPEPQKESIEVTASEPETVADSHVVSESVKPTHGRAHRKELLNAMKPYLSEGRRGALDSMSSILDILDVMGRKES